MEDAVHWSSVYGELIGFKERLRLLTLMRLGLPGLTGDAAREVRRRDTGMVRQQMELWNRESSWGQRPRELAGKRPGAAR